MSEKPQTTLPNQPATPGAPEFKWYVLKVQTNREKSSKEYLERRIILVRMESFFGRILFPTE